MKLPLTSIIAIEKCLTGGHSCEVKVERDNVVIVELSRKVILKEQTELKK
jgi:hypothetical protein